MVNRKIDNTGKLVQTTLPGARYGRKNPCAKIILYCSLNDMEVIKEAVAAVSKGDMIGVNDAGNHNGRTMVAICRQWLLHMKGK